MALCDVSKRLYVVTSCKKILVFDTDSGEKICQTENAHAKGIYGVQIAPENNEASIITCSADNTLKMWKLGEEAKQLSELATVQQFEGATEEVSRQLLGMVCFEEEGALKTIAVNLQGDLVDYSNGAPTGIISA